MTNPTGPTPAPPTPEPGTPPALERKSWQTSTAPTYIGLFLWVVYFDQLPRWTLAVGLWGCQTSGPSDIAGARLRDDEHAVKVGVNYRFGWGGPVGGQY